MARRAALLYAAFVSTLIEELGRAEATRLTRIAIAGYGAACGEAVRRQVEAMGLPNNPENYHLGEDLPVTGWDHAEVTLPDGATDRAITSCPIAEVFLDLGIAEIGRLYCGVDQAKQTAYNPKYEFLHTANVLDGDPWCRFALRERKDES